MTAARIIAEGTALDIIEANPCYCKLSEEQRAWYRFGMLDMSAMLINDLMPCGDLDMDSVAACVDAIHEWHGQLFGIEPMLKSLAAQGTCEPSYGPTE